MRSCSSLTTASSGMAASHMVATLACWLLTGGNHQISLSFSLTNIKSILILIGLHPSNRYVIRIPDNLPLDAAAPLLCAGITVFMPLKQHNMLQTPGKRLGVVGLGGLGHVAVKFGKAFGLHVTVISTSPSKEKEARQRLGADDFLVSTNPEQMKVANASNLNSLFVFCTVLTCISHILNWLKYEEVHIFMYGKGKYISLQIY